MTITSTVIIKRMLILFLFFGGLYFARPVLMPICIGGMLATLFLPFCHWMERRKWPRGAAVFVCLLLLLSIIAFLILVFSWKVSSLTGDLELIKQKATTALRVIQEYIFNHLGISLEKQSQILATEQPSYSSIMQIVAGSLVYAFTNFILTLAYFCFLLYYRVHLKNFLVKLALPSQKSEVEQVIYTASSVSQQYLVGLAKMIFCLWIMYGIGFSLLGVNDAIFFAILCGLLEIIPFIGNITGTTLTVLVAAVHGAKLSVLGGIVVTYATVQFIQGWLLEPLIVGAQVKINPLFTIIALVVGEFIWGIPGVFLAIPITAVFKIICNHFEPLKPYGFLIGEIESNKKKGLRQ